MSCRFVMWEIGAGNRGRDIWRLGGREWNQIQGS